MAAAAGKISQWALSALLQQWHSGRSDSAVMARGTSWAAATLLWAATPLIVLLLWVRYLPCHDRDGNLLLAALVLVTFAVAVLSFAATKREFYFELLRPWFQQGKEEDRGYDVRGGAYRRGLHRYGGRWLAL